jgi:surface protein
MFYDCSGLTSLDVSGFDTSNVTDMQCMFDDCFGLTSLDVSGFNTSNVKNMNSMFRGGKGDTENIYMSLTEIKGLENFDTSNVSNMAYMFADCNQLTYLNLSSFDTGKVTTMEGMYYNCSGLQKIDVGDGWSTVNVSNTNKMYINCTASPTHID